MAEPVERRQSFAAGALRLEDMLGTVKVDIGRGPDIEVTQRGPADLVDRFERSVKDGVLELTGPRLSMAESGITLISANGIINLGAGTIVGYGALNVMTAGGVLTIVAGGAPIVETTVTLPVGTAVTIREAGDASYAIGDTEAELDIELRGDGPLIAGRVGRARVDVAGDADVVIGFVADELLVDQSGDGEVEVLAGEVEVLDLKVNDGEVKFGGTAHGGRAKLLGDGDVTVAAVIGSSFRLSVSGDGAARVVDGLVDVLHATVSGDGRAKFGGTARKAELDLSGDGKIVVERVTEELNKRRSGDGKIRVKERP